MSTPGTFTLAQAYAWIRQRMPAAQLLNAHHAAERVLMGVSTDSRQIRSGALFVALRGERFDAHTFLTDASLQAAASAVVAEQVPVGFHHPAIIVPNTLHALGALGMGWRQQFSHGALQVVAVTGSNGKTTVKEMLASIFRVAVSEAHSLATQGNLNNEIGVPHTLLRLRAEHQLAVIELGMNHVGEIAYLAALTQPTVALVNNAQREHQEFMQSVAAVAEENGGVFASLSATGTAVFPADEMYTPRWRELAQHCRVMDFALQPGVSAAVTATVGALTTQGGHEIILHTPQADATCRLPVTGLHNVRNALAATACALAANVPLAAVVQGLEQCVAAKGRLQHKRSVQGLHVIDDTYNANPDSVRAAIDVLAQYPAPTLLVLGDMAEVGMQGEAFHAEVGAYAQQCKVGGLLTLGDLSRHASHAFGMGACHADSLESLHALLDAHITTPHLTVLVKGSRFMRMERVVEHVLQTQAQHA